MTKKDLLALAVVVLIVSALGTYLGQNYGPTMLGGNGPVHYQNESFLQGLTSGVRAQFSVSNAGVLTTTGSATFSGATTLSGAKTLSGSTTTLSASNLLSNSTSTGFVLRNETGNCYLVTLKSSVTSTFVQDLFRFATSSCN